MESIYIFADNEIIEYDGELAADTLVEFLYDVSTLWSITDSDTRFEHALVHAVTFITLLQVIEEPVEIIDNERELKGFYNMDEVIKLVGYFKSERSARRLKVMVSRVGFKRTIWNHSEHQPFASLTICFFSYLLPRLHRVWRCCWGVPPICEVLCHIWPQGLNCLHTSKGLKMTDIKGQNSTNTVDITLKTKRPYQLCFLPMYFRLPRSWNWSWMKLISMSHSWRNPTPFQESPTSSLSWLSTSNSTTGDTKTTGCIYLHMLMLFVIHDHILHHFSHVFPKVIGIWLFNSGC